MTEHRIGDWIQTYTGVQFYPLDPRPEDVRIEDIAHALSMQCRFTGHCREFYSVAEHSVRVAQLVNKTNPEHTMVALLHDAAEAYLVDLARPIKRASLLGDEYQKIEDRIQGVILQTYGLEKVMNCNELPMWMPSCVRYADDVLLVTEARDLMGPPPAPWRETVVPLEEYIHPWVQSIAKHRFLGMFNLEIAKRTKDANR